MPSPRTWPTSCSATVKKSVSVEFRPAVVVPKNQLVEPLSNAIEPPQGPKLVGVAARSPACPCAATVLSQAWSPEAVNPPVLPRPASVPCPSERPAT